MDSPTPTPPLTPPTAKPGQPAMDPTQVAGEMLQSAMGKAPQPGVPSLTPPPAGPPPPAPGAPKSGGLSSVPKKVIFGALAMFIFLGGALAVGIYLSGQQQDIQQKASGCGTYCDTAAGCAASGLQNYGGNLCPSVGYSSCSEGTIACGPVSSGSDTTAPPPGSDTSAGGGYSAFDQNTCNSWCGSNKPDSSGGGAVGGRYTASSHDANMNGCECYCTSGTWNSTFSGCAGTAGTECSGTQTNTRADGSVWQCNNGVWIQQTGNTGGTGGTGTGGTTGTGNRVSYADQASCSAAEGDACQYCGDCSGFYIGTGSGWSGCQEAAQDRCGVVIIGSDPDVCLQYDSASENYNQVPSNSGSHCGSNADCPLGAICGLGGAVGACADAEGTLIPQTCGGNGQTCPSGYSCSVSGLGTVPSSGMAHIFYCPAPHTGACNTGGNDLGTNVNDFSACPFPASYCGTVQCDLSNGTFRSMVYTNGCGETAQGGGGTTTTTTETPPTPPADTFVCAGLASDVPAPAIGDSATFTCTAGGTAANLVTRYDFQYQVDEGAFTTIAVSSSNPRQSVTFPITLPGTYEVQCRACSASACTPWDTL